MLHRVRRGEFKDVPADWSFEPYETARELSEALGASGVIQVSWLHALPVLLIASVLVGGIAALLIFAALA
jgi:hypothetical protein